MLKHTISSKPIDTAVAPATITFSEGKLKVEANNSDLSQILKNVADAIGMTIEGSIGPARVFGVYGPHSPRDVLTDLLAGAGCNFIMIGDTPIGAPRHLLLTQRSAQPRSELPMKATVLADDQRNTPSLAQPATQQPESTPAADRPPSESQDPEVRMRQMLKRLQEMREPPKASSPR